ncbi:MAG: SurA N-terminal domain-containing protein [Deltaproteobacteria bacterium]|nr:SurA N-terminal domain-containing protein [Deltaproteobacteria bacterium]
MLSFMRKHATSWAIKIILGSIVLVFVFWGMGNFAQDDKDFVATVNGERITTAQFEQGLKNLRNYYQNQFKDKFNELEKQLDLETKTVDQLVEARLWTQAATRLGFSVTDDELRKEISGLPWFSATGGFSEERYKEILRNMGYGRGQFEENIRETLLRQKLQDFASSAATVSESEILARYNSDGRRIAVDWVAFEPSHYTPAASSEKEARKYFEDHEDDYRTEPVMKAAVLAFQPGAFAGRVDVPADDIAAYYEEKASEFDAPKQVSARHILIKTDPNAAKEVDEAARLKALELEKRVRSGEDFAELAKANSDCPSKERGGDLGFFDQKTMTKAFADKAFSMKPGEISGPVKTEFGWHIIKLEQVKEGHKMSLEEASGQIRARLAMEDADELAFQEAQKAESATLGVDSLEEAAKKLGMTVITTDYFTKQGPAGMPNGAAFADAAFELEKGDFSETIQVPGAYYVIQVLDKKKSAIPAFEAVKDRVMADLAKKKAGDMARQAAVKFIAATASGKSFAELAPLYGLGVKSSEPFSRGQSIPGMAPDEGVTREVFMLSKAAPFSSKPVPGKVGFMVFALKKEELPDPKGLAAKRDELVTTLIRQKQARILEAYTKGLKAKAVVEYAPEFEPKPDAPAPEA